MTRDAFDLWLDAAHEHYRSTKKLPVVLELELYEYMGEWVRIIDVNVYRGGTQVTVKTSSEHGATVELEELTLRSRPQ